MNKELEALEYLKPFRWEDEKEKEAYELLKKDLTPPTVEEVCKALSEQLKTLIKTGKNKHGVTFNYVNTGKKLISLNYHLIHIIVQLPPNLIELVAKYYKGVRK